MSAGAYPTWFAFTRASGTALAAGWSCFCGAAVAWPVPGLVGARSWLALSATRVRAGRWEDVLEPLARALQLNPEAPKCLVAKGITYVKLGHSGYALAVRREAVSMEIDDRCRRRTGFRPGSVALTG